jgi:hypothetical protein
VRLTIEIAAFFDWIFRRGALALAGGSTSFCFPFTSGTVPLHAGAGTPSKPDAVSGRGMAWADRIEVEGRKAA